MEPILDQTKELTEKEIQEINELNFKEKCIIKIGSSFIILIPVKGIEGTFDNKEGIVIKVIDNDTAIATIEGKEGEFKIKRKDGDTFECVTS